jgi:hypothetical protein
MSVRNNKEILSQLWSLDIPTTTCRLGKSLEALQDQPRVQPPTHFLSFLLTVTEQQELDRDVVKSNASRRRGWA